MIKNKTKEQVGKMISQPCLGQLDKKTDSKNMKEMFERETALRLLRLILIIIMIIKAKNNLNRPCKEGW